MLFYVYTRLQKKKHQVAWINLDLHTDWQIGRPKRDDIKKRQYQYTIEKSNTVHYCFLSGLMVNLTSWFISCGHFSFWQSRQIWDDWGPSAPVRNARQHLFSKHLRQTYVLCTSKQIVINKKTTHITNSAKWSHDHPEHALCCLSFWPLGSNHLPHPEIAFATRVYSRNAATRCTHKITRPWLATCIYIYIYIYIYICVGIYMYICINIYIIYLYIFYTYMYINVRYPGHPGHSKLYLLARPHCIHIFQYVPVFSYIPLGTKPPWSDARAPKPGFPFNTSKHISDPSPPKRKTNKTNTDIYIYIHIYIYILRGRSW